MSHKNQFARILLAFLLAAISYHVSAVEPQDYYKAKLSRQCIKKLDTYQLFTSQRNETSREQVLALNKGIENENGKTEYLFPEETIHAVYDNPSLNDEALKFYYFIACRATENGLTILPLRKVATEVEKCADGHLRRETNCLTEVTNKALGLPISYLPPEEFREKPFILNGDFSITNSNFHLEIITLNEIGCVFRYPRDSIEKNEAGVTIMMATVGENGNLLESTLSKSSGFHNLDKVALNGLATCHLKPILRDGKPTETTYIARYIWELKQ